MDARRVLGVSASAGKTEVRAAYRRLIGQVEPSAGGTAGLVDLVNAAYRAAADGDATMARGPEVDPYLLLGVAAGSPHDEVRAAFRRVVQRVHPDRGGTDELFRVVDAAYDLIVDPLARLRDPRLRYRPPPPPPPPGPFRARAPETRRYEPPWRTWIAIAEAGLVLLGGVLVVSAVGAVTYVAGRLREVFPLLVLFAFFIFWVLRPWSVGMRRAVARLRSRRAIDGDSGVDAFLYERCLDAPVGREREDVLYAAYRRWCGGASRVPISQWAFLEYLRSMGVLYVNASSWEYGVLVGIRLRDRR